MVRQHEFAVLMDILRHNVSAPSCQHALVIGPRGTGKTMLLARVASELRLNDELAGQLLPVRFMEESYEVFTLADFWMEVLRHLATECRRVDPALADELRAVHASFGADRRSEGIADRVRATVLDAVERLGKKLVVMVENLHALNDDADEDLGWQLRQVLQTEPRLILLASATSRFKELDDTKAPFFEMFRVLGLDPLTLDECCRLWKTVTGRAATERQVRPLEILTGGNPRLLVMVAALSRHRSMRRVVEDIVMLVDEHTEYFRSNLEALPKTERRVFVAAIDLWRPSTSGEVAARAGMDVRVVSVLLGRLESRGAVVVQRNNGRRRYAVAERLYCFYYKLRRDRDAADVVKHLILFMANFYGKNSFGSMLNEDFATGDRLISAGVQRALDEDPDIANSAPEAATATWRHCEPAVTPELRECLAEALYDKGCLQLKLSRHVDAIRTFDALVQRFGDDSAPAYRPLVCSALAKRARSELLSGRFDKAIATCQEVLDSHDADGSAHERTALLDALVVKGDAECWARQPRLAIETSSEMEQRFGDATGGAGIPANWLARWIRARARGQDGDGQEVVTDVLWLYRQLDTSNENMVAEMAGRTYDLLVEGAQARDLLEVLAGDPAKVQSLWPLVVALQILAGARVRVPVEVLKVAEDIVARVAEAQRALLPATAD